MALSTEGLSNEKGVIPVSEDSRALEGSHVSKGKCKEKAFGQTQWVKKTGNEPIFYDSMALARGNKATNDGNGLMFGDSMALGGGNRATK